MNRETLADARKADRIARRSALLRGAVERRDHAEAEIRIRVEALRRDRVPWATIGNMLGVSAQAAQQRYSST